MKFFTSEWWATGCENAQDVFSRYGSHFAAIEEALPPSLVELSSAHTLHDAEVKHLRCDFAGNSLHATLDGWDRDLQVKIRYELRFSGVSLFDQAFPKEEYVESELGDLGYWECSLGTSSIEVEMLFVSGAEFRIVFQDFSFSHAPR